MGCSGSKNEAAPKDSKADSKADTKAAGKVKVFGMPPSANACAPILLAMHAGCGGFEMCNLMEGAQMKPEFLAMNPFHHIPACKDGEYAIGESNACLRYIAMKYMPECYPVEDPCRCGMIDFAVESFACDVYKKIGPPMIYPVFGFSEAPADQAKAIEEATEAVDTWMKHFVTGKFAVGDQVTIADFKAVPFLFACMQPAVESKSGFVVSDRAKQYVNDFISAVSSCDFLKSASGYSIQEFAASKEAPKEAEAAAGVDAPKEAEAAVGGDAPKEAEAAAGGDAPKEAEAAAGGDAPKEAETAVGGEAPNESEAAADGEAAKEPSAAAAESTAPTLGVPDGNVKVHGMPPSANAASAIILAMDTGKGGLQMCNLMEGAHMKPEFLAMNPFHHIPTVQDGGFAIGESSACLRYLAMKYKPEYYPVKDAAACGMIDFACESFGGDVYPKLGPEIVYPVFGFGESPADQAKSNSDAAAILDIWMKHFVKGKFVNGDSVSIADFKAVPLIFAAMQPAIKTKIGFEVSDAAKEYVQRFMGAVKSSEFMTSADGFSIAEYAKSREQQETVPEVQENQEATPKVEEPPAEAPAKELNDGDKQPDVNEASGSVKTKCCGC